MSFVGAPKCRDHKLVADVAVLAGDRVLMVRYKDVRKYDGQKGWFLPDDFLDHGEHPDRAAERILRDQAGIASIGPRLGHIESFDGGGGPWHLIFHYILRVDQGSPVAAEGNVADAGWFELAALPPRSEMAHEGWAADVLEELLRPDR